MKITGESTPESQLRLMNAVNALIASNKSRKYRQIWRLVDFQFKKKYNRRHLRNVFPKFKSMIFVSANYNARVLVEVLVILDGQRKLINFIAQNKAYAVDASAKFYLNPMSLRKC